MNKFIEKLVLYLYVFFTNIIYGLYFVLILKMANSEYITNTDSEFLLGQTIFQDICIYFFMGIVINQFSSVIIEPVLKVTKLIKIETHERFFKASKINPEVTIMSKISCFYRTLTITTLIVYCIGDHQPILLFISVIFLLSYKKQAKIVFYQIQDICDE